MSDEYIDSDGEEDDVRSPVDPIPGTSLWTRIFSRKRRNSGSRYNARVKAPEDTGLASEADDVSVPVEDFSTCGNDLPVASNDGGSVSELEHKEGFVIDYFPGAAKIFGVGEHLFQKVPPHSSRYHPFASKSEWELAKWLMSSGISVSSITEFLHLDYVFGVLFSVIRVILT